MMERYGSKDKDTHRYVLGAWKFMKVAVEKGQKEHRYRGCKYDAVILETDYRGYCVKIYNHIGKIIE